MASNDNSYQERYFERRGAGNARVQPGDSPYVRRHLERTVASGELRPGQRILEVGAGMGRFSELLLDRGLDVVASDLSAGLLATLEKRRPGARTLACDVAEIVRYTGAGAFDRIVGFFMLHHLADLDRVFGALREALRPGGRVAFCEPNAFCPLYCAQISFSRSMTWRGDGGVLRMRPGIVLESLRRAGFGDLRCERYGFTPPFVYNRPSGRRLDRALEKLSALEPVRAFQIFSATAI